MSSPYPSLKKKPPLFKKKNKSYFFCSDIVSGTFKGFALLRQQALASRADGRPAYLAGYGLVPPAQVRKLLFFFFKYSDQRERKTKRKKRARNVALLELLSSFPSISFKSFKAPRAMSLRCLLLPFPSWEKLPLAVPAVRSGQSASDRDECSAGEGRGNSPNFSIGQLRRRFPFDPGAAKALPYLSSLLLSSRLTHFPFFSLFEIKKTRTGTRRGRAAAPLGTRRRDLGRRQ